MRFSGNHLGQRPHILGLILALTVALVAGCQSHSLPPAALVLKTGSSGGKVLAIAPDSSLIATGTLNGTLRIWDLEHGSEHAAWHAHSGTVNGLLFLSAGRLLSAGYDGQMAIWSTSGRRLAGWSVDSPATALGAALSTGTLVTGHGDGKVRLWDLKGHKRGEWTPHAGTVRAVAISADGQRIASSGTDGQVRLWSPVEAAPRGLPQPRTAARTLDFSRTGDVLLGAGWFELYRWELPAGTLRPLPTEHRGIINSVRFLPDGRLATISRATDSAVLILDPQTGATLERIGRHDLCGTAVTHSPDGRLLASTSDDATVRIWGPHLPPFSGGKP